MVKRIDYHNALLGYVYVSAKNGEPVKVCVALSKKSMEEKESWLGLVLSLLLVVKVSCWPKDSLVCRPHYCYVWIPFVVKRATVRLLNKVTEENLVEDIHELEVSKAVAFACFQCATRIFVNPPEGVLEGMRQDHPEEHPVRNQKSEGVDAGEEELSLMSGPGSSVGVVDSHSAVGHGAQSCGSGSGIARSIRGHGVQAPRIAAEGAASNKSCTCNGVKPCKEEGKRVWG